MERGCGMGQGGGGDRCWGRRVNTIHRHRVQGEGLSGFSFFSLFLPFSLSVLLQVVACRLRFRRRKTLPRQASVQALVL